MADTSNITSKSSTILTQEELDHIQSLVTKPMQKVFRHFDRNIRSNVQRIKVKNPDLVRSVYAADIMRLFNIMDWRCVYCGMPTHIFRDNDPSTQNTMDHLDPVVNGGVDTLENIVSACGKCNQEKANMSLSEYLDLKGIDEAEFLSRIEGYLNTFRAMSSE